MWAWLAICRCYAINLRPQPCTISVGLVKSDKFCARKGYRVYRLYDIYIYIYIYIYINFIIHTLYYIYIYIIIVYIINAYMQVPII